MTEATCRRELDLEIPAEEVQKAMERVAREFARVARVPGFRPGKAPVTLIRRRFAEDIKSEVLQSLLPERIEQAVTEQKMVPVTRPQDRKITRLNSSHGSSSYAVFCLKKKKTIPARLAIGEKAQLRPLAHGKVR